MASGDLAPAPVWSELATFDARRWRGAVDCIVSGDPCTPNSTAGRMAGPGDDRFLAEQVVRVFDESGACRLFRENVPGNVDQQLAAFVPPLERLGCRVAVGIFSASEAGASHRRERLFLMADADSRGCWPEGDPEVGADDAMQYRIDVAGRLFAPGPADAAWPQILRDAPALEPGVRRVADGLAHRVDRLRACGGGAVPLVAAYAWRTLSALLAEDRATRTTALVEMAA
jgi:DNA (cytosine-5)-methyltransferase 1